MPEQEIDIDSQAGDPQDTLVEGASVDEFVPDEWPANVVSELAAWRQGDLLEGSPRFWAGPADSDQVIGTSAGDDDWEIVDSASGEGWVIINSQTCDIGGAGPGQHQPFVQVNPIFRFPDDYAPSKLEAIARWEVTYYAPLTNPPGDGFWVADLRLSMPVSKGMLLGRTPMHAFANELDALNFGEALAARSRRPAIHDVLSFDLPRSLGGYIKSGDKNRPEWWQNVEQVRLQITGDRLAPSAVGLVVVEAIQLPPEQRAIWRSWRNQCKRLLRPHRINVDPTVFGTLDQISARIYKNSVPVRLPELWRCPTW